MSRVKVERMHHPSRAATMVAGAVVSALDALDSVQDETRVWIRHLTGEGPATLRRQREAIAAMPASDPPQPPISDRTRRPPPESCDRAPEPRDARFELAAGVLRLTLA
jgi:hypothetical protein